MKKKRVFGLLFIVLLIAGCDLFSTSLSFDVGNEIEFNDNGFVREDLLYTRYGTSDMAFDVFGNWYSLYYSYETETYDANGNGTNNEGLVTNGMSRCGTYVYDPQTMILVIQIEMSFDAAAVAWTNNSYAEKYTYSAVFRENAFYSYCANSGDVYVKQSDGTYMYTHIYEVTNYMTSNTVNISFDTSGESFQTIDSYQKFTNFVCYYGNKEYYGGIFRTANTESFRNGFYGGVNFLVQSSGDSGYDPSLEVWESFLLSVDDDAYQDDILHLRDVIVIDPNIVPMRSAEEGIR